MRVARLRIDKHPGIGSLNIDFRDADGKAARLIVIAGENGTGKTAILQSIYQILTGATHLLGNLNITTNAIIEHRLERPNGGYLNNPTNQLSEEDFARITGFIATETASTEGIAVQSTSPIVLPERVQVTMPLNSITKKISPCFYSTSEVNFRVPGVQQFSPFRDDSDRAVSPLSTESLGTEIISLLVAIKGADDAELSKWVAGNPGQTPPEPVVERRIKRFRRAFASVMPHKRFVGIEQINNHYHPIFEDGQRKSTLSELSTGEKQIVFRGAFLLQQMHLLPGSVVLIDEPELGLHPAWQSHILDYYDRIVGNDPDKPSQIIITTHSPFVVHGSPTAKHIVLKRNRQTNCIEVDPEPTYPGVTPGDRAVAAFDLTEFSFGKRGNNLAIVTEGPTDAKILGVAWQKLFPDTDPPFDVLPARGAASISSLLGTVEGVPGPLADAALPLGIDRFIGLFDFDHEGFPQWNGMAAASRSDDECTDVTQCSRRRRKGCMIWAALLPVPPHRLKYASHNLKFRSALSIELMFPDSVVRSRLTEVDIAGSDYPILTLNDSQKTAIADACDSFPDSSFEEFRPIFELARHVLAFSVPQPRESTATTAGTNAP